MEPRCSAAAGDWERQQQRALSLGGDGGGEGHWQAPASPGGLMDSGREGRAVSVG